MEYLVINKDLIKFTSYYLDMKSPKWSLRTFHYNDNRGELVVTDGHKMSIIDANNRIASAYVDFYKYIRPQVPLCDNDLLFNLEFYLKYSKMCEISYKIQETKNSYTLLAINAKNDEIIASEPDLQCSYPQYEYAIKDFIPNTQAILNIEKIENNLKRILDAIKEHNKLCKLKKDKINTIDAKRLVLDLAFSNNELNISLVTYTSTTSNINLLDPELRLLNIFTCDYTSTSDNTSKHIYLNASYLLDILQSFKNLYETNITLHVNFNNKLPEPIMFLPTENNNEGIKSYLMPVKVQK